MEMSKDNFAKLKQDVKNALREVENKYHIQVNGQSIIYDEYGFTLKIGFSNLNLNNESEYAQRYKKYYQIYNLPLNILDKEFINKKGETLKFEGLMSGNRRCKFLFKNMDTGKELCGALEYVEELLSINKK